jgi:uncharacterized membrane protein YeiH
LVPEWLDLSAVVVGALAGVLVAQERELDLVGYVGMCLICALGGGLLRDVIMQKGDVYALNSRWPIPLCVITAGVGFAFPRFVSHLPNLYEWVDMISVALFVIAGTSKAMAYGLTFSAVVLMGAITGVGGGMLRDVFLGEIPQVFRRSNLYALCAVAGAICLYACAQFRAMDQAFAVPLTIFVVVAMRRVSLKFDIKSPVEVGLESKLVDAGNRMTNHLRRRKKH